MKWRVRARGRSRGRGLRWVAPLAALWLGLAPEALAFCGFYVGKADASLYNEASQVVLVRHQNKTVITMMNDYKGDLQEFALVVPVPVVLKKGQVQISDKKLFERIDAYSAPRLVEYFDEDPCAPRPLPAPMMTLKEAGPAGAMSDARARSLGVTIEAQYTVGEYDIVILSAKESDGLETWLRENGYHIPAGASSALRPYIRQHMKFFVAKVNLEEQAKTGMMYLRPLQFAFDSEKFMLPIRLGMVNAKGPQDLLIYVLSKNGRVETANYRTVKLPTGMDLPVFIADEFPAFYKSMFDRQVQREKMRVVFTEYVWNMGWCDPCAADPLSQEELKALGVFWLDQEQGQRGPPSVSPPRRTPIPGGGALPVIITRLHVRYAPDTFPEDLVFQETQDQQNFQGRYVLRHAWRGDLGKCEAAKRYIEELPRRQERELQTLANLTGWDINELRRRTTIEGR